MARSKHDSEPDPVESGSASIDVVEPVAATDLVDDYVSDTVDAAVGEPLDGVLTDSAGDSPADSPESADGDDAGHSSRRTGRAVAIGAAACIVAAVAIVIANMLGGSSATTDIPLTVSDPQVVLAALADSGFDCRGSVVNGDVGTCNSTLAVRTFDDEEAARAWVNHTLRDPMTNSTVAWVLHGNAVVSAPPTLTQAVATALGPSSQRF
ncbi:MAG TPA: hypothetical protein VMT88_14000 [Actinomycetes bacterium]|nr:hypothetical protein [Actinomycetes bacterium]